MPITYLVFAGDSYYPLRGAGDFHGAYGNADQALLAGSSLGRDWTQVVEFDGATMTVVATVEDGEVQLYPERLRRSRSGS